MEYYYLGKIVNTHGIKGEVRILSHFSRKELVFKNNFPIYIGEAKEPFLIHSYRKHKIFDMITLEGITNINDVLKYKGQKVYVQRSDLNLDSNDYVLDDLLGMSVVSHGKDYGVVLDIIDHHGNVLLFVHFKKNYYIPIHGDYIKKVDVLKRIIEVNKVEDLIL